MTVFINCIQKGRDHFKLCSLKRGRYQLRFPSPLLRVSSFSLHCKRFLTAETVYKFCLSYWGFTSAL